MGKIDFTVLIPVYNCKAEELIESVFSVHHSRQTIEQEYDIIIVDDASTLPETGDALEFLKRALNVQVLHLPKNMGTAFALNRGHELVKTKYVAIQGGTDISFPDRFAYQIEHLENHPEVDVLGTNLFSYPEEDPYRRPSVTTSHGYTTTLERYSWGWLTNHGTAIYKLKAVNDLGGYDESFRRGQDSDLWKRMHLAGKKIHTLPKVCYGWRRNK